MSKLQRLGTYLLRVIGNKWSILIGLATVAAPSALGLFDPTASALERLAVGLIVFEGGLIWMLIQRVYVLENQNEPVLRLRFEPRNEFMRLLNVPGTDAAALWVLVLPVVTSNRHVHRCIGWLAGVSVYESARWRRIQSGTSIRLRWQDRAPLEPLTLHAKGDTRQFLHVFRVNAQSQMIGIDGLSGMDLHELNVAPKFRLAVAVVTEDEAAPGATAKIVLEVEKTTDWAAPKVRVVGDLLGDR